MLDILSKSYTSYIKKHGTNKACGSYHTIDLKHFMFRVCISVVKGARVESMDEKKEEKGGNVIDAVYHFKPLEVTKSNQIPIGKQLFLTRD